jgi:hypothetical protein
VLPLEPLVPVVLVVLGLEVLPPQETSAAPSANVNVTTRKPRITTAVLSFWRRPSASIVIAIRPNAANPILNATGLPKSGRMCEEGPETNMLVVGVPVRVNVRVSVVLCAVLSVGGLNVHVSQLGSVEEFVSTSKQEKVTGPEKPF